MAPTAKTLSKKLTGSTIQSVVGDKDAPDFVYLNLLSSTGEKSTLTIVRREQHGTSNVGLSAGWEEWRQRGKNFYKSLPHSIPSLR